MRQPLKMRSPADELDGMVDAVIADPSRADDLKRMLRSRLRAVEPSPEEATDGPDLWDNVPV